MIWLYYAAQTFGLLLFPYIAIRVHQRLTWLSPILTCYATGIIVGNLFPNLFYHDLLKNLIEISVALAIPLLLFSSHIRNWIKHPNKSIPSFFLAMLGTSAAAIVTFFIFRNQFEEAHFISSMLAGVYSGGTINMSAISVALDVPQELFLILNGYDIIFSSLYFLFLISIAKPLLSRFLGDATKEESAIDQDEIALEKTFSAELTSLKIKHISLGLLAALIVLGISAGIAILIFGEMKSMAVILGISTLGILSSFIKKVRTLPGTFETGDYLLLVFALSMGAAANFEEMLNHSGTYFYYAITLFLLAVSFHLLLSKLFKVNAITFIVTSTAAVFGPPFIAPVANAIKHKETIIPGLTVAVIGNALGTYLGLGIAELLERVFM